MDMTSLDPTNLFFSIMFGAVGMGYTAYGKKNNFYFLICGLCLMGYTFIDFTTTQVILIGIVLLIAPFLLTRFLD
jgi:hypothetical protein